MCNVAAERGGKRDATRLTWQRTWLTPVSKYSWSRTELSVVEATVVEEAEEAMVVVTGEGGVACC